MDILTPIIILGVLAFTIGVILAFASKKFEVKKDERLEKIIEVLPGLNCGICGFAGCQGYAEAIINGIKSSELCIPGGTRVRDKISEILLIERTPEKEKMTARVLCRGDNTKTTKKYQLDVKIKTCVAANLSFWGDKSCKYGCVGYGDCEQVCQFDAIKVNDKGIAVVDETKCTACKRCAEVCPERIIKIVPKSSKVSVYCNSKDDAMITKNSCKTGCIACGICVKYCPVTAIEINQNMAVIDPDICINCGICELKCPTNAISGDIKESKKAHIIQDKCIGCGMCRKVCPVEAIEGEIKKKHTVIYGKCIGCEKCTEKCPAGAIEIKTMIIKK